MTVPNFQDFMLPLLSHVADGRTFATKDLVPLLANEFELSSSDRAELLESGRQTHLANRVGWAVTHLTKAGLLHRRGRGVIEITPLGLKFLQTKPARIDMKVLLNESAEYRAFRAGSLVEDPGEGGIDPPIEKSPDELMESSYRQLHGVLADDLLVRILALPPAFFEQLVVDLLVAMGYGGSRRDAGLAVGKSGDGGIDGVIKEDRLGLDQVYVQAKRWQSKVGQPVVRDFAGSLEAHRARKGVLITTSEFSKDAYEFVDRIEKRIVLINGQELAQLMIEHGVGVSDQVIYRIRRLDEDYFDKA